MADRVVRVTLSAEVAGYVSAMKEAAAATKGVETAGTSSAPAMTGAFAKIKAGAAQVGAELKAASSTKEWGQVAGTLTLVGGAVTAVGVAALKTGIQYNQLQQSSRAALTTLLGSAQAANAQMDKLDAFARTSPFSKATFIQAQQQMLAFGIETRKVIPYLDAVQNAVAASGGSNADIAGLVATMSKIKSSAKLTATDLMEFGNRGVDAAGLIGAAMGKTGAQIRSEITAGTIDADAALDALTQGMSEKFGGAADNVKDTFAGAMDRVSAAWRDFAAELAKPLVDPNGGGALVDLLNWSADAMRNFQALPEPVKATASAVAGIGGAGALAVGSLMLLVPKAVETADAFRKLSDMMPATMSGLSKVAKVGGGALAGLAVGVTALNLLQEALDSIGPSAEEMANKVTTATSGVQLLQAAVSKGIGGGDVARDAQVATVQVEGLGRALDALKNGTQVDIGTAGAVRSVEVLGKQLGDIATTNLPAAQRQFRLLAESANLSESQMQTMLDQMPTLKSALTQHATAAGVAADAQTLLDIAMGRSVDSAESNADALDDMGGSAEDAQAAVDALSDAIKGFGSTVLDSRDAARDFEEAIADAQAALESNGATLDITTEAGRENSAALDGIAEAANRAAAAALLNGEGEDAATAALERGRAALVEKGVAFGLTAEDAGRYADSVIADMEGVKRSIDQIPEDKRVTVTATADVYTAEDRLNWVARNRTAMITAQMQTSAAGPLTARRNFAGNLYDRGKPEAFYQGGFPSGIYRGVTGGIHKFAESEMGVPWEAYISGRPQDRDRNVGIWQETGRRLGVGGGGGAAEIAAAVAAAMSGVSRGDVNLSIVNPVTRDLSAEAWEAAQMVGGVL